MSGNFGCDCMSYPKDNNCRCCAIFNRDRLKELEAKLAAHDALLEKADGECCKLRIANHELEAKLAAATDRMKPFEKLAIDSHETQAGVLNFDEWMLATFDGWKARLAESIDNTKELLAGTAHLQNKLAKLHPCQTCEDGGCDGDPCYKYNQYQEIVKGTDTRKVFDAVQDYNALEAKLATARVSWACIMDFMCWGHGSLAEKKEQAETDTCKRDWQCIIDVDEVLK
jgi:uncharacterized coiled-coil protein SlyX